jgi:serine/threonine protein kinase
LIHQKNTIKLADFGLSRGISEVSTKSTLVGMIPYIDPKKFNKEESYSSNKKSDVYSIGVLLWEISSGKPPFTKDDYDISLAVRILQGLRETIVPGTPPDYVKLYTGKYKIKICIFFLFVISFIKISIFIIRVLG